MDEPVAVALKFGFLAVLYLFLLWVARSALKDLARGSDGTGTAWKPASATLGPNSAKKKAATA